MTGQALAGPPEAPRETILNVARDILASEGLPRLSMRSVAERVGISATAIYRHFEGKQELVDCVVERGFLRFNEYVESAISTQPRGSWARLAAFGEAYIRFALENRAYYRVIFSIQSRDRRSIDDLPAGGGYHMMRQCVVDAIDAGNLRNDDPDVLVHFLWSLTHGLVTLELACRMHCEGRSEADHVSTVELFGKFFRFLETGLGSPPGETPDVPSHDRRLR